MKTRHNNRQTHLRRLCLLVCLALLTTCGAMHAQETEGESPSPVLISEADSTRALATAADNWRGSLPRFSTKSFQPGKDSRALLFVTNLALLPDEDHSALRVYAQDGNGKSYRLAIENIQPVRRQPWIYGITVRLFDENAYNGQPQAAGDYLIRVTWRGLTSNRVRLNFGDGGADIKDDEGAAPTPAPPADVAATKQSNQKIGLNRLGDAAGDRARFMEQAAFGPNAAVDLRIRQIGIQRWINEQFYKPYPTFDYPTLTPKSTDSNIGCPRDAAIPAGQPDYAQNACIRDHYTMYPLQRWMSQEALYGDDQLRRRVSWALHQVWVVSGVDTQQSRWELEYIKLLDKHAFGNYRNLMQDMTLNPAMGNYLDMVRSTRRSPNENYPREILQLFSIGLDELNLNGTPKTVGGERVPTYDQEKVVQFTKVFTGWALCNQVPATCPNNVGGGIPNYIDPMYLNVGVTTPTTGNPGNHDLTEKVLFNYPGAPNATIPACTICLNGTNDVADIRAYANDSLNKTLDNIYNHPNVAPFVSKLLIQHLVTSDPSPAYVQRVATIFNQNRTNPSQMAQVIAAILLDNEARGSRKTAPDYGKMREPFQLATNLMRQFKVRASGAITVGGTPTNPPAACENRSDGVINGQTSPMAQNLWYPQTVFSYYAPDYVIPGTDAVGPEFAVLDTGTAFRRINFVNTMVYGQLNFEVNSATNPFPNTPCGTSLDLSEAQSWAAADTTGATLVDGLNRKMMYGLMSAAMRQKLLTAVTAIPSTGTNAARDRARQAVYLVATSSQYQVQK